MSERELPYLPKSIIAQRMSGSAVRKIMEEMVEYEIKLKEELGDLAPPLFKLGGGNPRLDKEAEELIRKNANAVINSDQLPVLLRYGGTRGHKDCIPSYLRYYSKMLNTDLSKKNMIFTPGSQQGLFYLSNGYEGKILVFTPDYVGYYSANFLSDFVAVQKKPIPDENHEFHYEMDWKSFESAIKNDKSINRVFISNPTNPSCEVHPPESMKKILKTTIGRALVTIDTPYRDQVFEGEYELFWDGNNGILDSYSKRGWAGERHSVYIGPEEVTQIIQDLQGGVCLAPSNFAQFVIARMMDNGDLDRVSDIQREFYRKRVKLAEKRFKQECNADEAMLHKTMGSFFNFHWYDGLTECGYDCYKFHKKLMFDLGLIGVPGAPFFNKNIINKADKKHPLETNRYSLSDVAYKDIEKCMTTVALMDNNIAGIKK